MRMLTTITMTLLVSLGLTTWTEVPGALACVLGLVTGLCVWVLSIYIHGAYVSVIATGVKAVNQQGYDAFIQGEPLSSNPYQGMDGELWTEGGLDASEEKRKLE